MAVRRQVGRAAAAVVVAGAMLSGCGGPILAGSAVVIGDRAIPLSQVRSEVEAVLSDPGAVSLADAQGQQLADLAREVVAARVKEAIVMPAAGAAGVTVSPALIDSEVDNTVRAALDRLGPQAAETVDPAQVEAFRELLHRTVPAQLTAIELGRRAAGGIAVTVDEVPARDRATAEKLAGALAAGGRAAEEALSGPGAKRGITYTAVGDPDRAGTVLFGVPQGAVVAYQPSPGNASWSVAKITSRRTGGVADQGAVDRLSQRQLVRIGFRIAQARTGPVTVNPRYGVWDPVQFELARPGDETGVVLLPG